MKKYPSGLFWHGFASAIVTNLLLFPTGVVLCFIGIRMRVCLYIGAALLLADIVLALTDQLRIKKAVENDTNPIFAPCAKLILNNGSKEEMEALLARMKNYTPVTLRERPELKETAAAWFSDKWHVPESAYLACMDAYLNGETEYGWYLCLFGREIVSGLGVIENDFHNRKDLTPNICAVYTEPEHRSLGLAGRLLNMAVADLRSKGILPIYLLTDHTGFYERYGWEYLCPVTGDGESTPSRMCTSTADSAGKFRITNLSIQRGRTPGMYP